MSKKRFNDLSNLKSEDEEKEALDINDKLKKSQKGYFKFVSKRSKTKRKKVSNFVFELKKVLVDEEGHHDYYFILKNDQGHISGLALIPIPKLFNVSAFRAFIAKKGCYIFYGSLMDLLDILEYEVNRYKANHHNKLV